MKNSALYFHDLESVVSANPVLQKIPDNASFLITGANGLLGGALIDVLLFLQDEYSKHFEIQAVVRNETRFRLRFSDRENIRLIPWDFTRPAEFPISCSYVIHAGCSTHPALFAQYPADTLTGIFTGTENLLKAALRCHGKMLFVSSGEACGFAEAPFREGMRSVLDPADPRSCYPIGKAAAENLCVSFSRQHHIPCGIVRPCHLYGPYFLPSDSHVFASMIRNAARGETFSLKSDGLQARSLCYSLDCASAVLTVLLENEENGIYNIAFPEPAPTIRTVAEYCARIAHTSAQTADCPPEESGGFSKVRDAVLDPGKLLNAGWRPVFDWKTGFAHSIEIRKQSGDV